MTLNAGYSATKDRGLSIEDQELIDAFLANNKVTILEPFASNKEAIKMKFVFSKRQIKTQNPE